MHDRAHSPATLIVTLILGAETETPQSLLLKVLFQVSQNNMVYQCKQLNISMLKSSFAKAQSK